MNLHRAADDEDHFDIGFEQIKLKSGLELEIQDGATGRLLDCKALFVLSHARKSVLIAFRPEGSAKVTLEVGKRYRVSGFSGKFDFAFSAKALKVDLEQSTVLLAAPAAVTIRFVRKHKRADLTLPAWVLQSGNERPIQVTIRNLSLGGAAFSSVKPLGASGDSITLRFGIVFENKKEDLRLAAVIRRVAESKDSLIVATGVEFVGASLLDKLLLHYYIATQESEFDLV